MSCIKRTAQMVLVMNKNSRFLAWVVRQMMMLLFTHPGKIREMASVRVKGCSMRYIMLKVHAEQTYKNNDEMDP